MTTVYGDITPRTSAYVVKDLIDRAIPYMVFEKFGQAKPMPSNATKTMSFRRYFLATTFTSKFTEREYWTSTNFDPTYKTLTEGVTPAATALQSEDTTVTLTQYGDLITISDVIMDTHEDPILKEATAIAGEQAAMILENARFNVLKAGTNAFYANGTARTEVNTAFTRGDQRRVTRALKRQLAKPITTIVKSTTAYNTQQIAPSFVGVAHPDCESDIRNLSGFIPAEQYGSAMPMENEVGKCEDVRYVLSTVLVPWAGQGAAGAACLETSNLCDVYPILYFAKDAYALVPFKGKNAVTPMVVNPSPSDSDPLAQRGHVSWKCYSATVILHDQWMARLETGVTETPS